MSPLVTEVIETGDVDTPDNDDADEHVESNIGFDTDLVMPELLIPLPLVYAELADEDEDPPECKDKFSELAIGAIFGLTIN